MRDAHDKYANQEVSYLLQRIEDYNGLIILATNMKSNIDDAFVRRFNCIMKFPFPDTNQRALIWERSFPSNATFVKDSPAMNTNGIGIDPTASVNAPALIKKYELSGGSIINVVHYASLKAVERREQSAMHSDTLIIYLSDIIQGIKKELTKEGKPFLE